MKNIAIGEIVKGEVSGIRPYGAFVRINQTNKQGLIHISECKNGYVANISTFLTLGQEVEVMVLNIDEYTEKVSLSLRALDKLPYNSRHINKKNYWTDHNKSLGYQSIARVKDSWIREMKRKISKK